MCHGQGDVHDAHSHRALTCKSRLAYHAAVADIYEALAAPVRRTILDELHDRDGQTLFEICGRLAMKHGVSLSRQAISQHLEVLEAAGLVHARRDGRYKFHHLDTTPLQAIAQRWPIAKQWPTQDDEGEPA